MKRMGAKKRPFYRIVVADSRSPRDGRIIETLGYYDPITTPATVKVDAAKYHTWIRNGAQPSESVVGVIRRSGALEAGDGGSSENLPVTTTEALPFSTETPAG